MNYDVSRGKIIVIGAGITGLTLAYRLSRAYHDRVVLFEKESFVGGLAATHSRGNVCVDRGSHRLHGDYDCHTWKEINRLCAGTIEKKKRKGLLYVDGRYVQYPPHIVNLVRSLGFQHISSFMKKYASSFFSSLQPTNDDGATYESFMRQKFGEYFYEKIFKPYALKLWDVSPAHLCVEPAMKRTRSLGSPASYKQIIDFFVNHRYFYYPQAGIGHIAERLKEEFVKEGGVLKTHAACVGLRRNNDTVEGVLVGDREHAIQETASALTVSTLGLAELYSLLYADEETPCLRWRSLRVIHIKVGTLLGGINETYYFPGLDFLIGRVSVIRRYSRHLNTDCDGEILTVEIPCWKADPAWNMDDEELPRVCTDDLIKAGIIANGMTCAVVYSEKLSDVYPVYEKGWRYHFSVIMNRIDELRNLFTVGRRGLFLHCNIDHCMVMASALAELVVTGGVGNGCGNDRWKSCRDTFLKFQARY